MSTSPKVWPFASAALGPPPLPAPGSSSASNKSLGDLASRKKPPPAASVPGSAVDKESDRLAPVYTLQNPRWTPDLRASWLDAANGRQGSAMSTPTKIDAQSATPELVLDHLARDGAVIVECLAPPSVCTEVMMQKSDSSNRSNDCLALVSEAAHALLAHPLVVQVCDAVLSCQALRMSESELSKKRMVLGGSFTSQRPLRQLPWEIDYARCDGAVHPATNPAPAVPSLLALEQKLTAVWQLSDRHGSDFGTAGTLILSNGNRVPVALSSLGTVLLALGGGVSCWEQQQQQQSLQAVGYQLGFLQPAQNHYLLAATATASGSDDNSWHKAVQALPLHIQRLLGFHMPGQVLNKVYAAPGPPDILNGLGALAGQPINWAHPSADTNNKSVAPVLNDPETQQYVSPHTTTVAEKLQLMHKAHKAADTSLAAQGAPSPNSVTELISREPELDRFLHCYIPTGARRATEGLGIGRVVSTVEWPETAVEQQKNRLTSTVKQMIAALDKDGAVVLSRAVSDAVCDAIQDEIAPYSWKARGISATTGGVVINGFSSGTNGSLLAKSTAVQAMAAHPAVVAAVEGVLGRQVLHPKLAKAMPLDSSVERRRLRWRVHVDLTIPKDPGGGRQQLHRDGDLSLWDCQNELDHAVSVIWALDGDFTNLRGTTRVVLGSHNWKRGRVAVDSEAIGAEMPRGSALIYVGRTYHGAGANSTNSTRMALNIAYNSSFLKQECNTFVTATPSVVRSMQTPTLVTELLGYSGDEASFLSLEHRHQYQARL